MKNHKSNIEEYIDLLQVVKLLYKEKILILSICLISLLSSFVISNILFTQKNKNYSTSDIKIQQIPLGTFDLYGFMIPKVSQSTNIQHYNKQFLNLIISEENLQNYYNFYGKELTNNIDLNKIFFENDEYYFVNYFFNRMSLVDNNDPLKLTYKLTYNDYDVDGQKFLNSYFNFTKKQVDVILSNYLTSMINDYLIYFENQYEIATIYNSGKLNLDINFHYDEKSIFTLGKDILAKYRNLLYNTKNKIESNHLLISNYFKIEKSSKPKVVEIKNNLHRHLQFGLILGFLFSLMVIFLKTILKKK